MISKDKYVFIICQGCQRRSLDASRLAKYFKQNGYYISSKATNVSSIIIVTDAFDKLTEDNTFKLIEKYKNIDAKLIVIGCLTAIGSSRFAQSFKGNFIPTRNIEEIDNYFPHFNIKFNTIPDTNKLFEQQSLILRIIKEFKFSKIPYYISSFGIAKDNLMQMININKFERKEVCYIRLSHGCASNCSYCSMKSAIGKLSSIPPDDIISEYTKLIKEGKHHFTLMADDLGSYGLDINTNFHELLHRMATADNDNSISWTLKNLHPVWAVRYKDKLIDFIKNSKIDLLLIPIQSANERVLKLMNRYSDVNEIESTLISFRRANPKLKLRTHVVFGFPTETEQELIDTLNFIVRVNFDWVSFFKYYDAEGIASSNIIPKVSEEEKSQRAVLIHKFMKKSKIKFSCDL